MKGSTFVLSNFLTSPHLTSLHFSLHEPIQIFLWWSSLSMISKRDPNNKEILVRKTETEIRDQVVGYSEGGEDQDLVKEDSESKGAEKKKAK